MGLCLAGKRSRGLKVGFWSGRKSESSCLIVKDLTSAPMNTEWLGLQGRALHWRTARAGR